MSTFLIIVILVAIAWFWLDSARARELAVAICREASDRYGVQLLDESVVLKRISLRWPNEGLRIWRQFSFDFSKDGVGREQGKLALTGIKLDYLDFDFSVIDAKKTEQTVQSGDVIPIRKNRH